MLPCDQLVARIRGEYREMPGLRLTLAQACRLWQVDATTCTAVLRLLTEEGFLARTADGAFITQPSAQTSWRHGPAAGTPALDARLAGIRTAGPFSTRRAQMRKVV